MSTKNDQTRFIEDYNVLFNVPDNKASQATCTRYKSEHTNEFKNAEWSIDKHRKKFMDWISSQTKGSLK